MFAAPVAASVAATVYVKQSGPAAGCAQEGAQEDQETGGCRSEAQAGGGSIGSSAPVAHAPASTSTEGSPGRVGGCAGL